MSDQAPPPAPPAAPAVPQGWYKNADGLDQWWTGTDWGVVKRKPNSLGNVALIIAAISFVICLVPFGVFLGGLGCLAAIVIGAIALIRPRKGTSATAIGLGIAGLIFGILISSSVIAGMGHSTPSSDNLPVVSAPVGNPTPVASTPPTPVAPAPPVLTVAQQQAVIAARGYLDDEGGFSYQGLIDQLSSTYGNGFTVADATAAVDSLNADYNAQAVIAAKGYLAEGGFSHASLVEQLTSQYGNKFTTDQAEYAATQVGL